MNDSVVELMAEAMRSKVAENLGQAPPETMMPHYRELARTALQALTGAVTRVDVVSSDGTSEFWADSWDVYSLDEGRTLKFFGKGDGAEARGTRDRSLAEDIRGINLAEFVEDGQNHRK